MGIVFNIRLPAETGKPLAKTGKPRGNLGVETGKPWPQPAGKPAGKPQCGHRTAFDGAAYACHRSAARGALCWFHALKRGALS